MIPEPTGIPALDQVLVWGSVASVLIAVGTGVWRLVRVLIRLVRRVEQYLTDWYGEPERPGVPARPGILVRLQRAEEGITGMGERLVRLEHEMQPNGSTSLRDAVDRVNRVLGQLREDVTGRTDPPTPAPPPDADR